MFLARLAPVLAACLLTTLAHAADALSPEALAEARILRERALADDTAYELIRSLTTEVGPRLAGSPGDVRAVEWSVARLKALGFSNVRAEPVTVPRWIRGDASAEITAPWPQLLVVAALGGSIGTSAEGIEAEVVPVTSLDELKAQPRERIAGRIVFFTARMERSRDGAGYGRTVPPRSSGAAEAAKLGAVAMMMRPAGTSTSRTPHTGAQRTRRGRWSRADGRSPRSRAAARRRARRRFAPRAPRRRGSSSATRRPAG